MKTSESIQVLYDIVSNLKGPLAAKNFVADCVYGVITDLQEEKQSITAEAIEERLKKVADDFMTVSKSKNDVA